MITVVVTFESAHLDEARVRKVAAEARGLFEGMAGLRSKVFTLDEAKHRARNVYVWESEAAAREFFSDALVARVTDLYGVHPHVEFADVIGLVENSAAVTTR